MKVYCVDMDSGSFNPIMIVRPDLPPKDWVELADVLGICYMVEWGPNDE